MGEVKTKRAKRQGARLLKLTPEQRQFVEGYATALQDIKYRLTGSDDCSKSYDPMTCEETVMHSYAFDMKDGGRHHPTRDYRDVEEILSTLLEETVRGLTPPSDEG